MDHEESTSILLVDDDQAFADLAAEHLRRRRSSFEIQVEYGGNAGLEALDETIDCVVSDYDMPRMNGLEFLREVRERWPDLPFILFTGKGSEEIASDAISAGVTDYLQKQTGTDRYDLLANRIENAVARRRSEQAASETESRYQTLFERHPHAVVVHDDDGGIYVNERFADLVGADDVESVADSHAMTFVHPEDRERVAERMEAVLDGDATRTDWLKWRLQRLDGEVRYVESRGSTVDYEGRTASQVVIRDVTHQRERERRLESLTEATRRLLTADEPDHVAEIAVDVLETILGEELTAVWLSRDGQLTRVAISDSAAALFQAAPPGETLPSSSIEYEVFESGEPQVVPEYGERDDSETDVLATAYLVPLGPHGLLGTGSVEPRSVSETERQLVTILAQSVTAAFDRLEDPQ